MLPTHEFTKISKIIPTKCRCWKRPTVQKFFFYHFSVKKEIQDIRKKATFLGELFFSGNHKTNTRNRQTDKNTSPKGLESLRTPFHGEGKICPSTKYVDVRRKIYTATETRLPFHCVPPAAPLIFANFCPRFVYSCAVRQIRVFTFVDIRL